MFSVYCTWYKSFSCTCAVLRCIRIIFDYEIGRTPSDICVLSCIGDETSSKNVQANRLFHLEIWGEHKVSFIVSRPDNSVFTSQEVFEAKQAGKRTKHKQTKTPASKATETEARRREALNAARSLAAAVVVRASGTVRRRRHWRILNSFMFIQSYSKTLLYDDDMVHLTSNLISITATYELLLHVTH